MPTASPTLRFALLFVLYFALGMGVFEASRGSPPERFVVETLIMDPTAVIIDALTPAEHVTRVGRTLLSPGANLHVTRGCEGIEVFLILAAGILAFPAPWRSRLRGLALGCVLAYGLAIGRLMALHYVLSHSPAAWEALHGLVLPLGPVLAIALYFLYWSEAAGPRAAPSV